MALVITDSITIYSLPSARFNVKDLAKIGDVITIICAECIFQL